MMGGLQIYDIMMTESMEAAIVEEGITPYTQHKCHKLSEHLDGGRDRD